MPGGVERVQDAPLRVAALLAEVVLPVVGIAAPIEVGAERDQVADAVRPFADDHLDDVAVAEPGAGDERVVDVRLEAVLGAPDRRDAALGVLARTLGQPVLRQEDDLMPCPRTAQRRDQAGDAAADDEKVAFDGHELRDSRGQAPGSSAAPRMATLTSRWGFPYPLEAMRPGLAGLIVLGACVLPATSRADIYQYRDERGTMVITNAPAAPSRLILKEPHLPPAPPILEVRPRGTFTVVARSGERTPLDPLIREIASRYGVEYALVKAVIKAESAFDSYAVSRAGALGLMQLMPATAAQHGVRNVFIPRENIDGGVRHLRMLLDRYGNNVTLAVAAYNAGTRRVEEAGGVPNIAETRDYVVRVLRYRVAYMREGDRVIASGR